MTCEQWRVVGGGWRDNMARRGAGALLPGRAHRTLATIKEKEREGEKRKKERERENLATLPLECHRIQSGRNHMIMAGVIAPPLLQLGLVN